MMLPAVNADVVAVVVWYHSNAIPLDEEGIAGVPADK
jgi:hypothetical protein